MWNILYLPTPPKKKSIYLEYIVRTKGSSINNFRGKYTRLSIFSFCFSLNLFMWHLSFDLQDVVGANG